MKIPPHNNRLMPYLVLPKAYQFADFVKNVFGATEQSIIPRSEGIIMHGELCIGDSVIMFADTSEEFSARPAGFFIYVENVDETYKKALELGAYSLREPMQQPYGYTCGFHDPFGNDWWPVQAEQE
jgi:PhnB protein